MDKLHRFGDDLDLGHSAPVPTSGTPGKSTLTAKLFRRPAPGRDDNGVAAGADAHVERAASSTGSPLPSDLQQQFGASLGADLSSVRVHTGGESTTAASAVGAKAYTVGNDIHFGAGHYDTSSREGLFLIAHEVAHTVQQAGSAPTRQNKLEVSSPHDHVEIEADRAADAMLVGERAEISSSSAHALRRSGDPTVLDPDAYAEQQKTEHVAKYEDVQVDGDRVRWKEKSDYVEGPREVEQSGVNVYGDAAKAAGWFPDPADPYTQAPISWDGAESAGPAGDPGGWTVNFVVKQPLPVRKRARDPLTGEETFVPHNVQPSQVAFAQTCVNAFQSPYAQAQGSWNAMNGHVKAFYEAGKDPAFHEGGLNWLTSTKPGAAEQAQNLEQLAKGQKVGLTDGGAATSNVDQVAKRMEKDPESLKGDIPKDKMATLEDKAGDAAAMMTDVTAKYDAVATANGELQNTRAVLATAKKSFSLNALENKKDKDEKQLATLQAKKAEIEKVVGMVFSGIDFASGFCTPSVSIPGQSYSAMKTFITYLASNSYEKEIKTAADRIKSLTGEIGGITQEVRVEELANAAAAAATAADNVANVKKELITALNRAESAYQEFAKQAGKQVGGEKGKMVQAALEALPKVGLLTQNCESIVAAISAPGYSEQAGVGMMAAASSPDAFVQHVAQLNGYKTEFTAKADHWKGILTRLEAIAKSYGLGN